jgi:hypothetical protein
MRALLLLFFIGCCISDVFAQCGGTFEIKSIQQNTTGKNDGKIVLTVRSSDSYTCELISYQNANRTVVATRAGSGNKEITFDNLDDKTLYRVTITFSGEDDPFCQTRTIDRITLTRKKSGL